VKCFDAMPNIAKPQPIEIPRMHAHRMMQREDGQPVSVDEEEDEDDAEARYLLDEEMFKGESTPEAQGCTAVCCVYLPPTEDAPFGKVVCANAGDSRAVLSRDGKAIALSEDHKPDGEIEKNRILNAGGTVEVMPGGDFRVCGDLNLSRAFGDFRFKKMGKLPPAEQIISCAPDLSAQVLTEDDTFMILACDGIWEKKSSQDAVDFINSKAIHKLENEDLTSITELLCDDVVCKSMETPDFDGSGCDNMTAMIVRFPHAAPLTSQLKRQRTK